MRLASTTARLFGDPPSKRAPRSEHLRWIRGFYLRMAPFALPTYALVLIYSSSTWIWIVLALSTLVWIQGFVALCLRIRRESQHEDLTGTSATNDDTRH